MLLMIDNYDSFTYNLVQYFGQLGQEVRTYRNDEITLEQIESLQPQYLVISPGPCTPNEAGISVQAVKHFAGKLPILGVCLGHQSIVQAFGGQIVQAKQIMHGKVSAVYHHQQSVFKNIKNPVKTTRYHSLVANKKDLPTCLETTSWTLDTQGEFEEIMGIKHKIYNIHGVQFHPESILTQSGHQMLENFLQNP